MKKTHLLSLLMIPFLLVINSCNPSEDEQAIITGQVSDLFTGAPISGATVEIESPTELSDFVQTDSLGKYELNGITVTKVTDITLTASSANYNDSTQSFKIVPGGLIENLDFDLALKNATGGGGGNSDIEPTTGAASIRLDNISDETINIAATGGVTTSTLTFSVQDSTGATVNLNSAVDIDFSIVSGPGGSESITPSTVKTDANGLARATLTSGNIAGVVKVQAKFRIVKEKSVVNNSKDINLSSSHLSPNQNLNNYERNINSIVTSTTTPIDTMITSSPVSITIHGGFPDLNHFSLTPEKYNIEGYSVNNIRNPLTVILGDEFSNPVKPGTAVYFETTGGIIQGSVAGNTDNDGQVRVDLISADPRPSDNITGSGGRSGYATTTAKTIDKSGNEIEKSINILFSTSKASISTPFTSVTLIPTQDQSISYSVTDLNGNPMVSGTTIDIETDGDLTLTGETSITMGDELFPGAGITSYNFVASAPIEFTGSETITFTVTSPLGTVTTKSILVQGTGGGGVTGPSSGAASMELVSISESVINIAESGGISNTSFTFQVQDSAGRNLDSNNSTEVSFSVVSGPGGGETITPITATTDAQGRVTSNLKSGSISGVVQIQAQIVRPEVPLTITSTPVSITIQGGFPDANHFSMTPATKNFEGYDVNNIRNPLTVILGDEFSNPVKVGTAVYFETTGGVIQGSGTGNTDADGQVSVDLISANPRPSDVITGSNGRPGYGTITATTVDKNSAEITKSVTVLFSTSKAEITTPFSSISMLPTQDQVVTYSITDLNGNPMAPGTTVDITTDGELNLTGSTSFTMEDELFPGAGITDFSFTASAPEEFSTSETITLLITSSLGITSTKTIQVQGAGEGGVTGSPTGAASMELISISDLTIGIAESGSINNSSFTFQVQDSAGRNLDMNNSVDVSFSILSGPGGGESIIPVTASTDAQGRVTSSINSGNIAGVVQILAQISRPKIPLTISSRPVAITIHGGFPDTDHFSMDMVGASNIEGYNRIGEEFGVQVQLGDEFSNPVKPGTAVYFETTGGIIEGSDVTNTDAVGKANVSLFTGSPLPNDVITGSGGRPGYGTITAKTVDKNNTEFSKSVNFLFSTSKAIITPDLTALEMGSNQTSNIGYTVTDDNGNPMAPGTIIDVTTDGEVSIRGNSSELLGDNLFPGDGSTNFDLILEAPEGYSGAETITITVTSASGTITTNTIDITGVGEGGVSGSPTGAASIILEFVERETINIKETGGIINSSFTFQVQDSAGRPLDLNNPAEVEFSILRGPGGGEGVLPISATTNSSGRVTSNLFSGNIAGVVMIEAKVTRADIGLTLRSKPVAVTIHGGFPDSAHFSITPESYNFGGDDTNGLINNITAIVGDKFSNPVKPGTAVYFETTGGIIEGSGIGHTDELGRVSVNLLSSNPRPTDASTVDGVNFGGRDGLATITARTINDENAFIEAQTNVVFSSNNALISATPTTFNLTNEGSQSFVLTITDTNGNPMPRGTAVTISASDDLEITGAAEFTMGDNILPGAGFTEFNFSIKDADAAVTAAQETTLLVTVTAPNGNQTLYDLISGTKVKRLNK